MKKPLRECPSAATLAAQLRSKLWCAFQAIDRAQSITDAFELSRGSLADADRYIERALAALASARAKAIMLAAKCPPHVGGTVRVSAEPGGKGGASPGPRPAEGGVP